MADPALRAYTVNTGSGTSLSLVVPAGAEVGDALVLIGVGYGSDAGMTPGSGWTQLTSQTTTTPFSATARHEVWVRDTTVQAGQPGSQTVTLNQSESDQINFCLLAFANVDPQDLLDGSISVVTSASTSSGSLNSGTVTTGSDGSIVVRSYAQWSGGPGASWTLSGQTVLFDVGSWDRWSVGVETQATAGETVARNGMTSGSSGRMQIITFAVKGASAATPVTGTAANSLPAVTQDASAVAGVDVAAANLLPAVTQSADGTVTEAVFDPDVIDEFERANTAFTLGTADTGQVWTARISNHGIVDGCAYAPNSQYALSTLDLGSSNGQLVVDVPALGGEWWIVFRYTDDANYWRFGTSGSGNYRLQAVVASALEIDIDLGTTPETGRHTVILDDRDITVEVNGVQLGSITQGFGVSMTHAGFATFGGDAGVRFERLLFASDVTTPPPKVGHVVADFADSDGPVLADRYGRMWNPRSGTWVTENGAARHAGENEFHAFLLAQGDEPDGELNCELRFADVDTVAGVIIRGVDTSNFILVEPTIGGPNDESKVGIYARDEGEFRHIVDFNTTAFAAGEVHVLTVWAFDDKITVRLDGVYLFDHTLSSADATKYAGGTLVGIYSHRQTGFDDGTTRFNSFSWNADAGAPVFGDAESAVPAITSDANGTITVSTAVASNLAALENDAVGEVDTDYYGGDAVVGSAASALPQVASSADTAVTVAGVAGSTVPAFESSAVGGSTISVTANGTLPTSIAAADGNVTVTGAAASTLAATIADANARVGDDVSAAVSSELPGVFATADGSVNVVGDAESTVPAIDAAVVGQVGDSVVATTSSILAAPSSAASGEVTLTGTNTQELPALTVSSSGVVHDGVSGVIDAALPAITANVSGRSDAVKRAHSGVFTVADSFAERFSSSQLPTRFEIAGTLAPRFDVADALPRRFFEIIFYRKAGSEEADDMELVIVPYGPHTATEVPRPLWIRVMERLRDQSVVPYPIHDVTPALTGSVIIEKPSGAIVGPRDIVIPDPATLHMIDPVNFAEDLPLEERVGWCYVEWKTGDFDEVSASTDVSEWVPGEMGHYGVQVTFDNRDENGDGIYLITPTVWSPQVRRGPASQVTVP